MVFDRTADANKKKLMRFLQSTANPVVWKYTLSTNFFPILIDVVVVQVWRNNMGKADPEKISDYSGTDFTCVTFSPDLKKFKMEKLDDDFVSLLKRRAYDMAGVCRGVSVVLNGEKIKVHILCNFMCMHDSM